MMSATRQSRSTLEERSVPAEIARAIRAVSGRNLTDMYDRETVMMLAAAIGFEAEAEWLVEHRHLYFIALELARSVEDEAPVRSVVHTS